MAEWLERSCTTGAEGPRFKKACARDFSKTVHQTRKGYPALSRAEEGESKEELRGVAPQFGYTIAIQVGSLTTTSPHWLGNFTS